MFTRFSLSPPWGISHQTPYKKLDTTWTVSRYLVVSCDVRALSNRPSRSISVHDQTVKYYMQFLHSGQKCGTSSCHIPYPEWRTPTPSLPLNACVADKRPRSRIGCFPDISDLFFDNQVTSVIYPGAITYKFYNSISFTLIFWRRCLFVFFFHQPCK